MTRAPARASRMATVSSALASRSSSTVPTVVRRPATSCPSLRVIGTPWSGPATAPRSSAVCDFLASLRARSTSSETTALSAGFRRSMRARWDSRTSPTLTSRALNRLARTFAGTLQRSSGAAIALFLLERLLRSNLSRPARPPLARGDHETGGGRWQGLARPTAGGARAARASLAGRVDLCHQTVGPVVAELLVPAPVPGDDRLVLGVIHETPRGQVLDLDRLAVLALHQLDLHGRFA